MIAAATAAARLQRQKPTRKLFCSPIREASLFRSNKNFFSVVASQECLPIGQSDDTRYRNRFTGRSALGKCCFGHPCVHQQRRFYGYSSVQPVPGGSMMTAEKVVDYLNSHNIDTMKHRVSSSHVILRECPFCDKSTKGMADNLYKCYIKINTPHSVYFCHRCGSKGSWYNLKRTLGDFDVQSVSQVRQGQQPPGSRYMSRPMSTSAKAGGSSGWRPSNFSTSAKSSQQTSTPPQIVTKQPDYTKRGYEEYLQPPPSNPNFKGNVATAPLPMPSQRLQALYSTQLLDTAKDSPVRDYLENERGLTVRTLRKYGIGQASYKFPNEDNNWVTSNCVTFPWIMSVAQVERQEILRGSQFKWTDDRPGSPKKDDDKLLSTDESKSESSTVAVKDSTFVTRRIKVRSIDQKAWQRMEPSGGGWGLFGWHTIPHDAKELVITEGEYDAMAVYQATGRPAVSLPNGCRSLPVEVLPMLENIDKIYLWMDNDAAGQEGAEAFAKKLGLERTHIVRPTMMNTFRLDNGPSVESAPIKSPKDANEALLNGLDLERIIEDSTLVPHDRIMTFQNLRNDVLHEILHPNKYVGAPVKSLPGLMGLIQGLRRGELTVLTGPTGSGKTTFLGQVSLDLAENDTNVLWGSFEIKNTRLIHKLLQQFAREPLPKGDLTLEDKIAAIADRFEQLPLYFLTFHGGSDVDQVLEAMDYAVYVNDVEHIILDNMQFMTSRKNMTGKFDKYDVQDIAIEKFRQFATERNVHVTLVVHPRKEAENERLSIASIYGSAKASQEADTVLILQSNGQKKWLEVKKNRFSGELGQCDLYFDRQACRYSNAPLGPDAGGTPKLHDPSPSTPGPYRSPPKGPAPTAENTPNFWVDEFAKLAPGV